MSTPIILVLGASNAIGQNFLSRAGDRLGQELVAVSRRFHESENPTITWLQHDLGAGAASVEASILISFGPVGLTVRQLEATPLVERVIAISSASTEFKSESPDAKERAQMAAIRADEARLTDLCAARGIGLSLFKTTMIYDGRRDKNVSRLAELAASLPFFPVAGDGLRQPVHADDLAALALRIMHMNSSSHGTWLLGGGETLGYTSMLRRIASAQGRSLRIFLVPVSALKLLLKLAHAIGKLRDVHPVMLERQATDLVVDDQAAREQLSWKPRPFEPHAVDVKP